MINCIPTDPEATSYVSLAEANEYFANFYYTANEWANAADSIKELALKNAAKVIDRLRFFDEKVSEYQKLKFPRCESGGIFTVTISAADAENPKTKFTVNSINSTTLPTDFYKYYGVKFKSGNNNYKYNQIKSYNPIDGSMELVSAAAEDLAVGDSLEIILKVPAEVKYAQCEIARSMIEGVYNTGRQKLQAEGVQSFSIGDLSETFNGGKLVMVAMPKEAEDLIAPFVCKTGIII